MTDGGRACPFGWPTGYAEAITRALMTQLGVTEAVTCASGTMRRPVELWSATNVGLVKLVASPDWDAIEAPVTPWRDVRVVGLVARVDESHVDPTAVLRLERPPAEIEIRGRSSAGPPRATQWPLVKAVLGHVAGSA